MSDPPKPAEPAGGAEEVTKVSVEHQLQQSICIDPGWFGKHRFVIQVAHLESSS